MGRGSARTSNLQRAREIRRLIESEYSDLRDGRITLREVVEKPQEYEIRRCDVYDVLIRAPKLGKTGAKRVLIKSRVWPHDRLGSLTKKERLRIVQYLPPRAR